MELKFDYEILELKRKVHVHVSTSHLLNIPCSRDRRFFLIKLLPGYFREMSLAELGTGLGYQFVFEVAHDHANTAVIERELLEVKRLYEAATLNDDHETGLLLDVDRNGDNLEKLTGLLESIASIDTPKAGFMLAELKKHYQGEIHMYLKESARGFRPAEIHQYRRRIDRRYRLVDLIDELKQAG